MPVSPARAAAFDILLRVERESSYASELLHSSAYERLSTADHGLATELVMGVLRWRSRLDAAIATASAQPLAKLDIEILIALRLAVYQFGWLDRVPKSAAVNESVELVKRARKRSAAPFVNAVLRKLASAAQVVSETRAASPDALARAVRSSSLDGRTLGPRIRGDGRRASLQIRSGSSGDHDPYSCPGGRSTAEAGRNHTQPGRSARISATCRCRRCHEGQGSARRPSRDSR